VDEWIVGAVRHCFTVAWLLGFVLLGCEASHPPAVPPKDAGDSREISVDTRDALAAVSGSDRADVAYDGPTADGKTDADGLADAGQPSETRPADVRMDTEGPPADASPEAGHGDAGGPLVPHPCLAPSPDPAGPEAELQLWRTLVGRGSRPVVGDSNGDGQLETYVYYDGSSSTPRFSPYVSHVYQWNGEEFLLEAVWERFLPTWAGDLDGDGLPAVVGRGPGILTEVVDGIRAAADPIVLLGSPAPGVFPDATQRETLLDRMYLLRYGERLADTDQDGLPEILFTNPFRILEFRDGDWEIAYPPNPRLAEDSAPGKVVVGDFDGDGWTEIVVPAVHDVRPTPGQPAFVYEAQGNDNWVQTAFVEHPVWFTRYGDEGDLDDDGRLDFVLTGYQFWGMGAVACWFLGAFAASADDAYEILWHRLFLHGDIRHSRSVATDDTDGDGDLEILLSLGDVVHLYEDQGEFDFRRVWSWTSPPLPEGLPDFTVRTLTGELADLDADGAAEVIVSRLAPPIVEDISEYESYFIFKRVD